MEAIDRIIENDKWCEENPKKAFVIAWITYLTITAIFKIIELKNKYENKSN